MNNLKKGLTTNELQKLSIQYLNNSTQCSYNQDKQAVSLNIDNGYYSLGCTITSIIKVCQTAISNKEFENPLHEPSELVNVLDIARQLVPLAELEFLDKITEQN